MSTINEVLDAIDDLSTDELGHVAQAALRLSTRRTYPDVASALDAGDLRRAADLFLEAADKAEPEKVAVIDLSEFPGYSKSASMTVRGPDAAATAERLRREVFLKARADDES